MACYAEFLTLENIFSAQLWQSQLLACQLFSAAYTKNRLASAYLLTGRAVADKWELVKQLAAHLNCLHIAQKVQNLSCLVHLPEQWCLNCRWIAEQEHPQAMLRLHGEGSKSGKIAVEKARELCQELSKESQYYRVVVVDDASQDIFHRPAANALLKTIEEPKSGIILIFFAYNANEVLPTVVSRCQTIALSASSLKEDGIWSLSKEVSKAKELSSEQLAGIALLVADFPKLTGKKRALGSIVMAEKLQQLVLEQEIDFDEVVDLILALEVKRLQKDNLFSPSVVNYAQELMHLFELAKRQNKQFVSKKAAIESLTFSWNQLQSTGKIQ